MKHHADAAREFTTTPGNAQQAGARKGAVQAHRRTARIHRAAARRL